MPSLLELPHTSGPSIDAKRRTMSPVADKETSTSSTTLTNVNNSGPCAPQNSLSESYNRFRSDAATTTANAKQIKRTTEVLANVAERRQRHSTKTGNSANTHRKPYPVQPDHLRRKYLLQRVLIALGDVIDADSRTSRSEPANRLFGAMRFFRDSRPSDPTVAVVMALYNALTHGSRYLSYSNDKLKAAHRLIYNIADRDYLSFADSQQGVTSLRMIGFDTMPLEMIWDDDDDYQDDEE